MALPAQLNIAKTDIIAVANPDDGPATDAEPVALDAKRPDTQPTRDSILAAFNRSQGGRREKIRRTHRGSPSRRRRSPDQPSAGPNPSLRRSARQAGTRFARASSWAISTGRAGSGGRPPARMDVAFPSPC
jgi:hypothetical protein